MKKYDIVTLTMNPSLDKSAVFHGLVAEQKIRCEMPSYDAGGGGINVSKAISRLGGKSLCVFTSGGSSGNLLEKLVAKEKIDVATIEVQSWTRENFIAYDSAANKQYRFGFPGGFISETEQHEVLSVIKKANAKFIVASGSLNEGLPSDFYVRIAEIAKANGSKFIVDTSGESLKKVLEFGVFLAKPNIGELAKLFGPKKLNTDQAISAAKELINKGSAEIIVVSLGSEGALLVNREHAYNIPAPEVERKSTVGAGDSMVGGMVWALSQDKTLKEVIQYGVACGSAATMNPGTQLFKIEDAARLLKIIQQ